MEQMDLHHSLLRRNFLQGFCVGLVAAFSAYFLRGKTADCMARCTEEKSFNTDFIKIAAQSRSVEFRSM
jgi:hypothetical protein